ncbi:MerR family transcriptional regulator [Streptococcus merionis]|uniref:MerR family transcriptional regulator n=1 Tax=Streptococcus merionis TaxID=400065 RepID=UPI0026F019EB|nr:MerR family transcriptional regulator [Streptococcus merionis]
MRIKEVSEQLNLPTETIRYWEKVGIAGTVERDVSGYRKYSPEVVEWLQIIKCFREIDIPIETIKAYINLTKSQENTFSERKVVLENHRQRLEEKIVEYQLALEKLNKKIANYEQLVEFKSN